MRWTRTRTQYMKMKAKQANNTTLPKETDQQMLVIKCRQLKWRKIICKKKVYFMRLWHGIHDTWTECVDNTAYTAEICGALTLLNMNDSISIDFMLLLRLYKTSFENRTNSIIYIQHKLQNNWKRPTPTMTLVRTRFIFHRTLTLSLSLSLCWLL